MHRAQSTELRGMYYVFMAIGELGKIGRRGEWGNGRLKAV
jgi:hypothetical protein